jgi:hypothetical protein
MLCNAVGTTTFGGNMEVNQFMRVSKVIYLSQTIKSMWARSESIILCWCFFKMWQKWPTHQIIRTDRMSPPPPPQMVGQYST